MNKSEMILLRARKHALMFIERDENIRSVAARTGFSKDTVNLDLHRIKDAYPELYFKVLNKLNHNKAVKHFRGGYSTQEMYRKKGNK
jgi:hypothetical protein